MLSKLLVISSWLLVKKLFNNQKGAIGPILVVILLLAGLGVGYYLTSKPTNLKPKASTSENAFFVDDKGNPITTTKTKDVFVKVIPPWPSPAAKLSLVPSSTNVNKGCNYTADVMLDTGGINTDGTDATILFDPQKIKPISITSGSIYPDFPGNSIDPVKGRIEISGLSSPDKGFAGRGLLARINFTVLKKAQKGAIQMTFDFDPSNKNKTDDSNVVERKTIKDVLDSVENVTFQVGNGKCNEKPKNVKPTKTPGGFVDNSSPFPSGTPGTIDSSLGESARPEGGRPPDDIDVYKSLVITLSEKEIYRNNPIQIQPPLETSSNSSTQLDSTTKTVRVPFSSDLKPIPFTLSEGGGTKYIYVTFDTIDLYGRGESIKSVPYPIKIEYLNTSSGSYFTPSFPSSTPTPVGFCTKDALICPDGTAVGRVPPSCEFKACPGTSTYPTPYYGNTPMPDSSSIPYTTPTGTTYSTPTNPPPPSYITPVPPPPSSE